MTLGWRPLRAADLPAIAAIERACHAPLPPEGEAVFARRLDLFPEGCLCVGAPPLGYAIAHPARLDAPPALGAHLARLPDDADCLWLHDVALLPAARGHGLVAALLARLLPLGAAHGLGGIGLVAVHGTAPLWARHGFVARPGGAVGSYGAGAVPMVLRPATPAPPSPAPGR